MKKTKIFYGNQYIESFVADGKRYTKWQLIKIKAKRIMKKIAIGILVVASIYGIVETSRFFFPSIEVKIVETIKTVEVTSVPPILKRIAKCESNNKQFKDNGDVLRGKITPSDIGKYQINEPIWNDLARRLGYDIFTEVGNEQMAIYIYQNFGTDMWSPSKKCWR
jgi:hypothetical protein